MHISLYWYNSIAKNVEATKIRIILQIDECFLNHTFFSHRLVLESGTSCFWFPFCICYLWQRWVCVGKCIVPGQCLHSILCSLYIIRFIKLKLGRGCKHTRLVLMSRISRSVRCMQLKSVFFIFYICSVKTSALQECFI